MTNNSILFIQPPLFNANEQTGLYPSLILLGDDLLNCGIEVEFLNIDHILIHQQKEKLLNNMLSIYNTMKELDYKINGLNNIEEYNKFEVLKLACSFFSSIKYKFSVNNANRMICNSIYDVNQLFDNVWYSFQQNLDMTNELKTYDEVINCMQNQNIIDIFNNKNIKDQIHKHSTIGITVPLKSNLTYALLICREIKRNYKNKQIILGGAYFSTLDQSEVDKLTLLPIVDYIVKGCGRNFLRSKLVNDSESKQGFVEKKIIEYDRDRNIKKTGILIVDNNRMPLEKPILKTIANIFSPDTVHTRASIMHSQGCYWGACTYCNYRTLYNKNEYFKRETDAVLADISTYYNIGYTKLYFITESLDRDSALLISNYIIENKFICSWKSFLRCEDWDIETLMKIKISGGESFVIGLETINDRLLKLYNKGISKKMIIGLFDKLLVVGLKVEVNIIPDFPTTTIAEIYETLEFINKYKDCISRVNISRFVVPCNCLVAKNPARYKIRLNNRDNHDNSLIPYERLDNIDYDQLESVIKELYRIGEEIYCSNIKNGKIVVVESNDFIYHRSINESSKWIDEARNYKYELAYDFVENRLVCMELN